MCISFLFKHFFTVAIDIAYIYPYHTTSSLWCSLMSGCIYMWFLLDCRNDAGRILRAQMWSCFIMCNRTLAGLYPENRRHRAFVGLMLADGGPLMVRWRMLSGVTRLFDMSQGSSWSCNFFHSLRNGQDTSHQENTRCHIRSWTRTVGLQPVDQSSPWFT